MAIQDSNYRAPVAAHPQDKDSKRPVDAGGWAHPAIEIRDLDSGAGKRLRHWVHDRLGRHLGKFAQQIERIDVRFGDVHGPKGGVDRSCMVHVILSGLPPVIVEMMAETHKKAFDLAAGSAERATRRNLEKHGLSTGHKRRNHHDRTSDRETQPGGWQLLDGGDASDADAQLPGDTGRGH